MNDTTFQGDGKVAYVPVVVNTKLKKPSNGDVIRAMSDEELAEWITELTDCAVYPYTRKDSPCVFIGQTCAVSWLDWLGQEAT